ncbi:unnamed protein product [Didymodactylos carnosus]|uniref:Uncharacterized protein n=1 Tax=Didymodactylos carnosus TaxID=1234261 RepID=A0A815W7H6_9BILA|nr:unnamed protein product [Didymodactylos carnosus]CAF4404857.1 unnamed protein product [Didymodactylos carnosus]
MTSNSKPINYHRGEVCEQTSSDLVPHFDSTKVSSFNSNNGSDPQLVHISITDDDLLKKNDKTLTNPSLTANTSLVNSSSSAVRRPLSVDIEDDDFQTVSHKRSSDHGRNHATVQKGAGIGSSPSGANALTTSSLDPVFPHLIQNGPTVRTVNNTSLLTKQIAIIIESTRYALTRYPFSPVLFYILKRERLRLIK